MSIYIFYNLKYMKNKISKLTICDDLSKNYNLSKSKNHFSSVFTF
jgi:hypothetical protein